MNHEQYYLKCSKVVTENAIEHHKFVLIKHGIISEITDTPNDNITVIELDNQTLVPGMIDMHIHGREGCDVMDAKLSSLATISESLAKHGVTGFLATTVTASWQQTLKAFEVIGEASHGKMPGAQVLGAYNEGLFFTETHKGAHNEAFFLELTKERVDDIYQASQGTLKVMALAPEFEGSLEIIRYLDSLGVNVMLGHTNATYQQATEAFAAGACGGVHVFNGMSGIHHRDPGCAGAVLTHKEALAEVIADGVHLHPTIMNMIYRLKGKDKIALISDCINAGGFSDGTYRLGELDVVVKDGIARTEQGSLAGSTLTLEKSVKNITNMTEIPFFEAVHMASLVPAVHLGLADQLGSIAVGKRACLAVLDDELNVNATIIDGEVVFCDQGFAPLTQ
ncbi:N-acetylglucosamine-6-phosphate deacetylase [Thalassotalea sp. 1_MG-2023]|uniref:N-acetylglucosamine-6-phosphate deacetylase n=1 Tax=Thalassotalea sp. 1_MG-2023 TaxID=3062680 RepID=UPI0026E1C522|nr:N-acetylglucosamine-6-phosphate deacetylase [Thalassotalea sp. 1_MG-2023]MDO6428666.1 N-acetylglucosamine-6-phosphate deacetylase [Thalassotalea sp. 1_MG-2023]